MLKFVMYLAALVLATAHPSGKSERILEDELTAALQEAFAPYDPYTMDSITGFNVTTDHSSIMFTAVSPVTSGFSQVVVNNFVPPIPFVSKSVLMEMDIPFLYYHSDSYTMEGTHDDLPASFAGKADLTLQDFDLKISFKADHYSLEPMSVCVQPDSLSIDLSVVSIQSEFEGADDINNHINTDGAGMMEGVEDHMNANANNLVNVINAALCNTFHN